jgi:hypothetical protein
MTLGICRLIKYLAYNLYVGGKALFPAIEEALIPLSASFQGPYPGKIPLKGRYCNLYFK